MTSPARVVWTEAQRRQKRREYARYYEATALRHSSTRVEIPADVTVLERDPSPCFMCGVRADVACRHRPWSAR